MRRGNLAQFVVKHASDAGSLLTQSLKNNDNFKLARPVH